MKMEFKVMNVARRKIERANKPTLELTELACMMTSEGLVAGVTVFGADHDFKVGQVYTLDVFKFEQDGMTVRASARI